MNVLTIKGFSALNEISYDGVGASMADLHALAHISGRSADVLKKLKPTEYAAMKGDLISQTGNPSKAAYLVKYKGKTFGYYPAETGTVEDMIGIEIFSKGKKWNALAALMFREVKPISKWAHRKDRRWSNELGLKVKNIGDFKKDSLTYTCKGINFEKMDLSFWDDFPWALLLGQVNFLIGSGVQFSLSIHPSSLKNPVIRSEVKRLRLNLEEALIGSLMHTILPKLMFLSSTGENERSILLQGNSATSQLDNSSKQGLKQLRLRTNEDAWVVTGDANAGLLEGVFSSWDNILNDGKLAVNELLFLSGLMKANKLNNRIGWFVNT